MSCRVCEEWYVIIVNAKAVFYCVYTSKEKTLSDYLKIKIIISMKKLFLIIVILSAMLISTNRTMAAPPAGTKVTDINVQTRSGITNVEIDGTLQMIARIMPNNATIKTVLWSVNDTTLASVGATTGLLTGKALGSVWVIAAAIDGSGVKDSMQITVIEKSILITGIRVTSENGLYEVSVGNNLRLVATVEPDSATDTTVKWTSSNMTLATVSMKGLVTALAIGEVWIRARANDASGIVDSVKISIKASIPVTDVIITGDSVVAIGTTTKLKVNVVPDNATDTTVTWSSGSPAIATVSMSGMVSGVAEGYAWIRAISKSNAAIGDSVRIHVTKFIKITDIDITTNTGDTVVAISDTLQMIAAISPDSASNQDINWTVSNSTIASVSSKGLLIGKAVGTVTVTATANDGSGVKGTIIIKVVTKPVTSVKVTSSSDTLAVALTMQMSATVLPLDATNPAVIWSVDNGAVASIDANTGILTGIAKGKVTVIATAKDGSAIAGSKQITVVQFVPVTKITVETSTGDTLVGLAATLQMTALVVPDTASVQTVTWSVSNTSIASIDANGVLTGKALGTVTVTASATDGSGIKGTKNITIVIVPVSKITVSSESDTVFVSLTIQMTADVQPADATDKSVVWSVSNASVATIDAYTGVLTGVASGSVDVTATAKDGSAVTGTKTIKIFSYTAVSSVAISSPDSILSMGNSMQLTAVVKPDNASIKEVAWKVSNSLIAGIDQNGLLTGINPGKVLVTATATDGSGKSATKLIEIVTVNISSITVATKTGTTLIYINDSIQMVATILPVNASYKDVNWTVSNTSVATISATGMLLAKSAGTVIVTATSKDGLSITGSVTLTVATVSIAEEAAPVVQIYPVPATDVITISGAASSQMHIVDMSGRVVLIRNILSDIEVLDISMLSPGIFFIQFNNGGIHSVARFVKQ